MRITPVGISFSPQSPHEQKTIEKKYDLLGRLIAKTEKADRLIVQEHYTYDLAGRKISSKDRFDHLTFFEYDAFDRLTKVTYPTVLDENENRVDPGFAYAMIFSAIQLILPIPKEMSHAKPII